MTKKDDVAGHTAAAGPLPNACLDHAVLEANARAGKADIYEGAIIAPTDPAPAPVADVAPGDAA